MSDGPNITLLGSEEELIPWWLKVLPLERTGKKISINTRKLTYWAGAGVVLFAIVQIVLAPSEALPSNREAASSFEASPESAFNTPTQLIPEATAADLQRGLRTK